MEAAIKHFSPAPVSPMELATISPLCNHDSTSMSPKELIIEAPGEVHLLAGYVCDRNGCYRCYHEASGYFDFVAGKPILDGTQILCERIGRRRAKTSRRNPADLAGTCSGGKFVSNSLCPGQQKRTMRESEVQSLAISV
jgi:hypothetical protein